MPYRDELVALTQELEQKSSALEAARGRRETVDREAEQLAGEVSALEMRVSRARRRLDVLGNVDVASPCQEPWENMRGDDRQRYCGRCEKNVYNLSGFTTAEAARFVEQATGETCIRFYRRVDGTMLTQDCPVGRRKKTFRVIRNLAIGGVAVAGVGTVGVGMVGMTMMGKMARRDVPVGDGARLAGRVFGEAKLEHIHQDTAPSAAPVREGSAPGAPIVAPSGSATPERAPGPGPHPETQKSADSKRIVGSR